MSRQRLTLGRAIDECVKEATEEWYRQHAGLRSREQATAEDWKLITTTSERRPGGFLRLYVGIVTRSRFTTEQYAWVYRYKDGGGFERGSDGYSEV